MIEDIVRIKRQVRDRLNKCSDISTLRRVAVALGHRPSGWPYSTPLLPIPTRGKLYTMKEFKENVLLLIRLENESCIITGKGYFACPMWMSDVEVHLGWIYSDSYENLPKAFTHVVWFPKLIEEETHA